MISKKLKISQIKELKDKVEELIKDKYNAIEFFNIIK